MLASDDVRVGDGSEQTLTMGRLSTGRGVDVERRAAGEGSEAPDGTFGSVRRACRDDCQVVTALLMRGIW